MKPAKILAIALLGSATALYSCSGKGNQAAETTDSISADSAVQTIDTVATAETVTGLVEEEVIDYLTDVYTRQPSEGEYSPEFQDLVGSAEMTNTKMGADMPYFEYDLLTQSQDPGKLKGVKIVSLTPDKAVAKVSGDGFGENGSIEVTVVKADGKYKIDDIEGEKAKLKKFLER